MQRRERWLIAALACAASQALHAQPVRAVLDGRQVVRSADSLWAAALARQTRAADGSPGPRHWVQGARYELRAIVDPRSGMLRADGMLRYRNRSPDTLRVLALNLAQNLFRKGAPHNEYVPVTGGLVIDGFCVARMVAAPTSHLCAATGATVVTPELRVDNTVAWLTLPSPLLPGDSVDIRARWHFRIPSSEAPRTGIDGTVSLLAYWYPQFSVYDDVAGWDTDPYLATGEFHQDHADYDVRITVPAGYLVAATGTLQNAAEVLTPAARERLQRAAHSFATVPIINDSLRRAGAATAAPLSAAGLQWQFTADSVRDFAFYTSRDVTWDAMAALVPRANGTAGEDTVLIHALYRPREREWRTAADMGRQSIEHFSRLLWPYPWPQLTIVEGVVEGGMEYPMLTAVSVGRDAHDLLTTIGHEVGHMWFPMQVSSDERRFAWMDEGMASWMERHLLRALTGRDDDGGGLPDLYRTVTAMRAEQSMMTHADHYASSMTYTAASYDKLVVVLQAFRAEHGDSALVQGLRAYGTAWAGRHPYPADFTRMVFAAAGLSREAFVREWVLGTGHFDARIDGAVRTRDTLVVTIRSAGGAHLSVPVVITRRDGRVERRMISAADFRLDAVQVLHVTDASSVMSIVLDPDSTRPDVNITNQRWTP